MNNDYRSPSFKRWLDKLQQESWQLELIISGFAIYALILAYEPLELLYETAKASQIEAWRVIWSVVQVMWGILIFNLVLHVILRGLWIGAVGLRYVSGDIDYKALNYSEKFTTYLKKNVGSFDKYIGQLEKYCSVLFAISFLLIFYMLASYIIMSLLVAVIYLIATNFDLQNNVTMIVILISVLLISCLLMLIVFIDFIGQGILKKNKYVAKIYFPIYWLFSYLTLSFLYRPLVYNFLDNKFGKRLVFFLIPIYAVISILGGINFKQSNYLKNNQESWENYSNTNNYEDLLIDRNDFIEIASIPSKVIKNSHLKIFILFKKQMEDQIFKTNSSIKPEKDIRGFNLGFKENYDEGVNESNGIFKNHKNELKYLHTFERLYQINIDTTMFSSEFVISTDKHKRLGFETYLNIRDLKEGKHILRILAPPADSTQVANDTLVTIPFWHFKD
ncbi:hypothetical protein [Cellulophaga baltica]|uniref:hypothetical protein n=1 Tax=Cellulophaga baltica TaxID=76594 RepID=UPI0012DC4A22|nr:hypothetical protein [Cellulophaga baltica]